MKMKTILTRTLILIGLSAMMLSCKKNNVEELLDDTLGSMTMKIDGVAWSAKMAYVVTASGEEEDVFAVAISGFSNEGDEDEGDALTIWMALPVEKFNNPKGTYDVIAVEDDAGERTMVTAMFNKAMGLETHRMYTVAETSGSFGKITITDFKIGQQTFLGQVIGGKAYTRLKGTFEMNLAELKMDGSGFGGNMAITEGKFDVKNHLNF